MQIQAIPAVIVAYVVLTAAVYAARTVRAWHGRPPGIRRAWRMWKATR